MVLPDDYKKDDYVSLLSFSPDNNFLLAGFNSGNCIIYSISQLESESEPFVFKQTIDNSKGATAVAVSPDGNKIFIARYTGIDSVIEFLYKNDAGEFHRKKDENGKDIEANATFDSIKSVTFSPDGNKILLGHDDGKLSIVKTPIDNNELDIITTLSGHNGEVISVAFSSDETYIFSGSTDGTIKIWKKDDNGNYAFFQTLGETETPPTTGGKKSKTSKRKSKTSKRKQRESNKKLKTSKRKLRSSKKTK